MTEKQRWNNCSYRRQGKELQSLPSKHRMVQVITHSEELWLLALGLQKLSLSTVDMDGRGAHGTLTHGTANNLKVLANRE